MAETPRDVVARRLREIRDERRWSQPQLAERLEALGPDWHPVTVSKIEKRSRGVSVDDLFALALALDVAPVHLMVPIDDDERVAITEKVTATAREARWWVAGEHPLAETDERWYFSQAPAGWEDALERRRGAMALAITSQVAVTIDRMTDADGKVDGPALMAQLHEDLAGLYRNVTIHPPTVVRNDGQD